MSRDYFRISQSIQDSNDKLYTGEHRILQELESIKKDMKIIHKKLDKISEMLVRLINGADF